MPEKLDKVSNGHAVLNCGLCGSAKLRQILDLGMQPLAEVMRSDAPAYPLRLVQCSSCDLVQLDYIAPQAEVFPPEHPYASGNAKALHEHFQKLADELSADLKLGDMVLDIGCNDGTLLSKFPERLRRAGIDPTNQMNKVPVGIDAYNGFFGTQTAENIREHSHGKAKVITATNVLAHVPDPHDFLEGVKLLLADDGVFVTENHSLQSVLDGQWDTVYHEHARFYSPITLQRLAEGHGLVQRDVKEISTHGGSFRSYFVHAGSPLPQPRTYRAVDGQVQTLQPDADFAAEALRQTLAAIVDGGGYIYGIGATTRASAVIQFAGLRKYLQEISEVATSEKIGRVMPGTNLPICPESNLFGKNQPAAAVLFSWHLAEQIVPKLRANGYKGLIIVPLPSVRYV